MIEALEAARAFDFRGSPRNAARYGHGHVNDTFLVEVEDRTGAVTCYIVQRVNDRIFSSVAAVMDNIGSVTRFVRSRLEARGERDVDRRTLTLIPTRDGRDYHVDGDGRSWRAYVFIDRAQTYDLIETPQRAYQAARAFGEFARLIDAFPHALHDTIPAFHDTQRRFDALTAAIGADAFNRAQSAGAEIAFCTQRETLAGALNVLRKILPGRIAHNDTKMNNVLIDDATELGTCVVDLDTVMQGLSLFDYGDMIRTSVLPVAEDAPDVGDAELSLPMFEAVTRGYVEGMGGLLSHAECASLVLGAKVLAFESAVRFLTDYLQGDVYFKTERPHHNLDRTRTQIALLEQLERREEALTACVVRVLKG